ncbi:ABC transporter permease [Nonomuraea africana]|uniref:Phospholipid/cholesterol/gamma-HCH transport system permease protein n=1 Tax=Nonomuraea africana TaxID=46171 RepID=A0ABR9KTJ9_9ACTN|nr:ABC transporter permease [Nonomuraea africana]MBE1565357.1 phospholipid/cholesterol/gamma-HCH transport system permease protein [Nonomuraea africana]
MAHAGDTARAALRRPFHRREFLQQAWFIVSVSELPTALVAIPFGAVPALQSGNLIRQFGAQSFTGGTAVLALVREASSVVIAGAAGSALCADLGARVIREEIDAMRVLGIDPLHRLVVPRVAACALVTPLLNGLVRVVGLVAGHSFSVLAQGGSPGAYLQSFSALARLSAPWTAEGKALVFSGCTAGLIASYKGLSAAGRPKGVGDAVNQTVVFSAMALFAENFLISAAAA